MTKNTSFEASDFFFLGGGVPDPSRTYEAGCGVYVWCLCVFMCCGVIGILPRLRHTVPIDVLLLLNSLVLTHINYSLLVWGHNPFRITKLQKKCL